MNPQDLRDHASSDHQRGCQGRCYSCECGYDSKTEPLLMRAADEIELLRGTVQDLIDAYLADVNPNDRNETAVEHARRHLEQT